MAIKPSGVSYDAMTAADIVLVVARERRRRRGRAAAVDRHADAPRPLPRVRGDRRDRAHPLDLGHGLGPGRARDTAARHDPRGSLCRVRAGYAGPDAGGGERDYEGATGDAVIETIGDRSAAEVPCVLVRGHAPFCWGRSPSAAVETAVTLEEVAKMALLTTVLERDPRCSTRSFGTSTTCASTGRRRITANVERARDRRRRRAGRGRSAGRGGRRGAVAARARGAPMRTRGRWRARPSSRRCGALVSPSASTSSPSGAASTPDLRRPRPCRRQIGDARPIVVGSGVLTDIVRYAAHAAGRDFISVPTAASMDGYASAAAAMQIAGLKVTSPARAPVGIYADPGVLAAAPIDLTRAGIGDLLAKVTARVDWLASHFLYGEPFPPAVADRVLGPLRYAATHAPDVLGGDVAGAAGLLEGLIESGHRHHARRQHPPGKRLRAPRVALLGPARGARSP